MFFMISTCELSKNIRMKEEEKKEEKNREESAERSHTDALTAFERVTL